MARCDELAAYTEEPGRITRPYGTPALIAARERVARWMREAGMDVRIDAVGNLRGRARRLRADGARRCCSAVISTACATPAATMVRSGSSSPSKPSTASATDHGLCRSRLK